MKRLFQTNHIFSLLVWEIQKLINEDVIVTNEYGKIVASTDESRLNKFHEGALLAIKQRKQLMMTKEHTLNLAGVKKGILLPIIIDQQPIGVLGITGTP